MYDITFSFAYFWIFKAPGPCFRIKLWTLSVSTTFENRVFFLGGGGFCLPVEGSSCDLQSWLCGSCRHRFAVGCEVQRGKGGPWRETAQFPGPWSRPGGGAGRLLEAHDVRRLHAGCE